MQEEYTNVITLTDSDGSDVDFEVLDIVPYKEHEYVVMLPVDDESDSPEAVILELLEAEEDNEEDMLQGVEKIVFVTRGAASAFLLSDLLSKGESGEAYRLTHDAKAVTFTLGESTADVSAILTKP